MSPRSVVTPDLALLRRRCEVSGGAPRSVVTSDHDAFNRLALNWVGQRADQSPVVALMASAQEVHRWPQADRRRFIDWCALWVYALARTVKPGTRWFMGTRELDAVEESRALGFGRVADDGELALLWDQPKYSEALTGVPGGSVVHGVEPERRGRLWQRGDVVWRAGHVGVLVRPEGEREVLNRPDGLAVAEGNYTPKGERVSRVVLSPFIPGQWTHVHRWL